MEFFNRGTFVCDTTHITEDFIMVYFHYCSRVILSKKNENLHVIIREYSFFDQQDSAELAHASQFS